MEPTATTNESTAVTRAEKKTLWSVIFSSSVGTLIEWYDFYLFGSLAITLSEQFFPKTNPTAAFLSALATFAAAGLEQLRFKNVGETWMVITGIVATVIVCVVLGVLSNRALRGMTAERE